MTAQPIAPPLHAAPLESDRAHFASATCWCSPVLSRDIGTLALIYVHIPPATTLRRVSASRGPSW